MTIAAAQNRITHLASQTAVHRTFHWLHLHQPQLRQWLLDVVRIPAPPFAEQARAAWMLDRFHQLDLSNAHIDEAGNALAEISSESPADSPVILISAHLDTVFPAGTSCEPIAPPDTSRIYAPGICDNAAGLTGLLAIVAALKHANISPPVSILFAANVGEEGEGDLRGMRHLFERSPYANRIAAALILDGSGSSAAVTRALGSLRFRITVTGPGGHSWSDAGAPNPILILSQTLLQLAAIPLPSDPLTTLNVGSISGGTSINSIPESATALLDLRSEDPVQLTRTAAQIREIADSVLPSASPRFTHHSPKISIETIGNRPAGALDPHSPILHALRAVDRHLNIRTELRLGSTDANIPIAKGIPALALGTGGIGGGIHTLQEWYDPTGRETALRRILLTLLDIVQTTSEAATLLPTHRV
ncbi:peptidase M20 [Edaphobacter acidisoli]|uniref:Peptidase M20 n=1 Tax=Edaphobacter acidisoli TaxID=2040573 RepID=A0A916RHQ6_9BACT|nr:M20/M25/M40 family metallo-hydrolase [Edaphobacter acidisoli]GGA57108.1 peptidase M20 [Edaphobacter acidisoli]